MRRCWWWWRSNYRLRLNYSVIKRRTTPLIKYIGAPNLHLNGHINSACSSRFLSLSTTTCLQHNALDFEWVWRRRRRTWRHTKVRRERRLNILRWRIKCRFIFVCRLSYDSHSPLDYHIKALLSAIYWLTLT